MLITDAPASYRTHRRSQDYASLSLSLARSTPTDPRARVMEHFPIPDHLGDVELRGLCIEQVAQWVTILREENKALKARLVDSDRRRKYTSEEMASYQETCEYNVELTKHVAHVERAINDMANEGKTPEQMLIAVGEIAATHACKLAKSLE